MVKKFSVPGWYSYYTPLLSFFSYYYNFPKQFYEDRIIDSVYDVMSYMNIPLLWAGGRIPWAYNEKLTMEEVLKCYNDNPSMKIRHVFTNCLLDKPEFITDWKCNEFVKRYIRSQDEVIINHPKLIEHFEKNYPNIPIIYSTTMNIMDINIINKLSQYNLLVLNYNLNNNKEVINSLLHKENIELICGEPCIQNCPNRNKHYEFISKQLIEKQFNIQALDDLYCPHVTNNKFLTFDDIQQRPHFISNERIDELSEQGFQYFKISGRGIGVPGWIETILYYLALPEYRKQIRDKMLMKWW